jgi:hypothetical protein
VFSPPADATAGPQLNTPGQIGEGPTQAAGRGDAPSTLSAASVPLSSVLPHYQAAATQALDRLALPPSQRALVQAYFAALAAGR